MLSSLSKNTWIAIAAILVGTIFTQLIFKDLFWEMLCLELVSIGFIGGKIIDSIKSSIWIYASLFVLICLSFWIGNSGNSGFSRAVANPEIRFVLTGILFGIAANRKKLSLWIFAAMIFGVEFGIAFPEWALEMKRFGDIFLRLIKTLVAPLLFSTLVVGIAGHSDLKQVGRIGLKSILYFEIVTTFALFIGLGAINISQAGSGADLGKLAPTEANIKKGAELMEQTHQHKDHLVDIFPENFAKAIAENQVLQIVVFSILFAIALSLVKNSQLKHTMLNWTESLTEVMFKFTDIVMYVAPLAVFGAITATVASAGTDILMNLMKLVVTLYIALVIFAGVILVPIALIAKIPLLRFIKAVTEPISLAFATASSEAALPKALENMERFGVPKKIVGFVIPTGYSFNLDGTTLYLSMATVFVAQLSGVELTLGQQIGICLTLMLTSKGVAGVRGASFVILTSTVSEYGLDVQKASIILGIDALMDMGRTAVNVLGNCLACAVIARSEGELSFTEELEETGL